MSYERIGPVEIIVGEKESRAPFSTSLLIKGSKGSTLIDCGAGQAAFDYFKRQNLQQIYLTHFHPDHTWGTRQFSDVPIVANPYDYRRFLGTAEMLKGNMLFAQAEGKDEQRTEAVRKSAEESSSNPYPRQPATAQLIYPYEQVIDMSGTKVIMLHAPGHCEGFCCPYFPDYGILHVGDFDLTSFGPWYFNSDSHIDQFIESGKKTLQMDAKYYITSHQKGMVLQAEYREKLLDYLDIIERREQKIKQAIKKGCAPQDLDMQEVFYFRKNIEQNPRLKRIEQMGLVKHLQRLVDHGEPYQDYFEEFVAQHKMRKEYINYFTQPVFYGTAVADIHLDW
jgi:hydroxyacylglutathione hydrolase